MSSMVWLETRRYGMPSGAFALYVDQSAGGGPNAHINRVVPLPVSSGDIRFGDRRLTLYYDDQLPGAMPSVVVDVRFLGAGSATTINLNAGDCQPIEIPREACAASLHVDPAPTTPPGSTRGAISALVEFVS
jgi:hypothetical protein